MGKAFRCAGAAPTVAPIPASADLLYQIEATRLKALLCGKDGNQFVLVMAALSAADCRKTDLVETAIILAAADLARWTATTILPAGRHIEALRPRVRIDIESSMWVAAGLGNVELRSNLLQEVAPGPPPVQMNLLSS